jgi:hypothetical protein
VKPKEPLFIGVDAETYLTAANAENEAAVGGSAFGTRKPRYREAQAAVADAQWKLLSSDLRQGCRRGSDGEDHTPILHARPSVIAFARAMEARLAANDHKGGWDHEPASYFLERIEEELKELKRALKHKLLPAAVLHEAADVANFLMMLAESAAKAVKKP